MNTIWIDLDNSPHVPLFKPVIEELNKMGIKTIVTARDYAQTIRLLELWNIKHIIIGQHGGKSKVRKIINLFHRAWQLIRFAHGKNINLALSHGSRTQLLASRILGIRSIVMLDYEFTERFLFNLLSTKLLIPTHIPDWRLRQNNFFLHKVIRYNGFKEQLYLKSFVPDCTLRNQLAIDEDKVLVTLRPSAMLGNYHNILSEKIILKILDTLIDKTEVYILVVSRTKEDKKLIEDRFSKKIRFLERAVDGLQLIWNSDVFISGGGTMSREAALLGVPTYSIFTGKKPYLDEYLAQQGKLVFIDTLEKACGLVVQKRHITLDYKSSNEKVLQQVVEMLLQELY
ncbi:MAG: DUF354 domain-containing protein [Thermodesulfobacteriota bacterium]|jgi:predicted glycosyltransferase|nr:MAG: DUF354 domain-containing protein [Thermodesulfobacteriota bacterium]